MLSSFLLYFSIIFYRALVSKLGRVRGRFQKGFTQSIRLTCCVSKRMQTKVRAFTTVVRQQKVLRKVTKVVEKLSKRLLTFIVLGCIIRLRDKAKVQGI